MQLIKTPARIESKYIANFKGINPFLWHIKNARFFKSYDEREVNSLYYDDIKFTSINDNLSGITPRTKYRLRWYKDKNGNQGKFQFEKKIKNDITGYKEIIIIDNNINIFDKEISIKNLQKITGYSNEKIFPIHYSPVLICSYIREYYEAKDGSRFTIDKNIKFKRINNKFIDTSKYNFLSTNQIIMELKFDPSNKTTMSKLIKKLPMPSIRCSKYLIGHSKLFGVSYI